MNFLKSSLSPNLPKNTLEMPIIMAKQQGPSRSPSVLETPSEDSANADAHWLIPCSDAPAQSIIRNSLQNTPLLTKAVTFMPPRCSKIYGTGMVQKL